MHPTALANCKSFFECYGPAYAPEDKPRIVEIGSQDVNGSLRSVAPGHFEYVGVDFAAGKGVDVVLTDPYQLPFETGSADIVLSSSCFEHSEMFWLVFLEVLRVLKPRGLFYLNVPSNGHFHRYPVDCWRFYPDSGRALAAWGKRNGIPAILLESYTSEQNGGIWNDFVAVFLKDEQYVPQFPRRIVESRTDVSNGLVHGSDQLLRHTPVPEDQRRLAFIHHLASGKIRIS